MLPSGARGKATTTSTTTADGTTQNRPHMESRPPVPRASSAQCLVWPPSKNPEPRAGNGSSDGKAAPAPAHALPKAQQDTTSPAGSDQAKASEGTSTPTTSTTMTAQHAATATSGTGRSSPPATPPTRTSSSMPASVTTTPTKDAQATNNTQSSSNAAGNTASSTKDTSSSSSTTRHRRPANDDDDDDDDYGHADPGLCRRMGRNTMNLTSLLRTEGVAYDDSQGSAGTGNPASSSSSSSARPASASSRSQQGPSLRRSSSSLHPNDDDSRGRKQDSHLNVQQQHGTGLHVSTSAINFPTTSASSDGFAAETHGQRAQQSLTSTSSAFYDKPSTKRRPRGASLSLHGPNQTSRMVTLAAEADNLRRRSRSMRNRKNKMQRKQQQLLQHGRSAHAGFGAFSMHASNGDFGLPAGSFYRGSLESYPEIASWDEEDAEAIGDGRYSAYIVEEVLEDWHHETLMPYGCYSPTCPCKRGPSGNASTWPHCKCYTASCTREHRQSYWQCPKLKKLVMRERLKYALSATKRQQAEVGPYMSFLPSSLCAHVVDIMNETDDADEDEMASALTGSGAVLFADASGFTRLTERLSKLPNGAELLCSVLNAFFEVLVEIVQHYGGDIIKFAGDALLITWSVGVSPNAVTEFRDAVLLAAKCSLDIHERLHNYKATVIDDEEIFLSLHMGIGCGPYTSLHVGGALQRMEFIIDGPPMAQIGVAEPLAEPGETVLSPEAWQELKSTDAIGTSVVILHERARVQNHERKAAVPKAVHSRFMRLDKLLVAPPAPPVRREAHLRAKHLPVLKRYIPRAVTRQLDAGHSGHLAEMREVSILFVRFDNFQLDANQLMGGAHEAVERGNALMLHVQHCIYTWEGSINKFIVDDKGLLVLCVFGLPPMKHADDAIRATSAARLLVKEAPKAMAKFRAASRLAHNQITCSVGVSTGHVFCGVVGATKRREYTVLGRTVNLAARLMQVAAPNEVLVCETTRDTTEEYFEYVGSQRTLKGIGNTTAFVPTAPTEPSTKKGKSLQQQRIARRPEIRHLSNILSEDPITCVLYIK
ncbi:hypothetical protein PTSG_09748 [Salpingoeca rosetta]|uniref:Guanylate cyclase domain-containing protein n=1 Tax=Salpingoeca rosetta (strain ATCC 50818 / BSB-021) TaxID=946362 RepID=F2UNX9_SALR5|nr:uncharacterized protein PTSG_09748 [Salpingoeca rosetta]EGD79334.1 hypothetical protein PTSG_09748 [Salpingoeca rosetta]|eukprot:XP_004989103.1 hypothetical protein PTSG_09748 [Salpingoeca rosetta]